MTHQAATLAPHRLALLISCAGALACTEPNRAVQSAPAPTPPLAARIELSDSLAKAGSELRVTVRVIGAAIGSATARIAYDSAGLTFVAEEPLEDGAMRAINSTPGLVRVAAVAGQAGGLTDGRMWVFRFTVRRADAVRSIKLFVDELHTVSHVDGVAALRARSP